MLQLVAREVACLVERTQDPPWGHNFAEYQSSCRNHWEGLCATSERAWHHMGLFLQGVQKFTKLNVMRYWTFFSQCCGNSKKYTFKKEQMDLVIAIELEDFEKAETLRSQHEDGKAGLIPDVSKAHPGHVSHWSDIFSYSAHHSLLIFVVVQYLLNWRPGRPGICSYLRLGSRWRWYIDPSWI